MAGPRRLPIHGLALAVILVACLPERVGVLSSTALLAGINVRNCAGAAASCASIVAYVAPNRRAAAILYLPWIADVVQAQG